MKLDRKQLFSLVATAFGYFRPEEIYDRMNAYGTDQERDTLLVYLYQTVFRASSISSLVQTFEYLKENVDDAINGLELELG